MDQQQIVGALASNQMFDRLSRFELGKLAQEFTERNYEKNDVVFLQGDVGDALFVLVSGALKIMVTSEDGEEMVLVTLEPPATLGELALVDHGPRSASAIALEPSRLLVLPRSRWERLVEEHDEMQTALVEALARTLRRLTDQAADFVFLDLPGRVAKMLLRLSERAESGSLDIKMTQTDIAHMVGGSRQSVNQILKNFESRGYIDFEGPNVVIRRLDRLQHLARV